MSLPNQARRSEGSRSPGSSTSESELDNFQLDGTRPQPAEPEFELEAFEPATDTSRQSELYLPDPEEDADNSSQLELEGLESPVFAIQIEDGRTVNFKRSHSILEALESARIFPQYQCREGYCGSCRAELLEGEIHYLEEPLAWLDDGEILLCCCVPRTPLQIRLFH
ncbi:MAG: class I ribonucleotide reductase maintenance protein YfaE [Oceanobacter sp.]